MCWLICTYSCEEQICIANFTRKSSKRKHMKATHQKRPSDRWVFHVQAAVKLGIRVDPLEQAQWQSGSPPACSCLQQYFCLQYQMLFRGRQRCG